MTAQVYRLSGVRSGEPRFRVVCVDEECPRPLDLTVATEAHADNLAAKHDREHHPTPEASTSYDVSAAARSYLASVRAARRPADTQEGWEQRDGAVTAAEEMWHALTGLTGQTALEAAEHAAEHPTIAHTAPF